MSPPQGCSDIFPQAQCAPACPVFSPDFSQSMFTPLSHNGLRKDHFLFSFHIRHLSKFYGDSPQFPIP